MKQCVIQISVWTRKTLIMLSLWTEVTDLNHSATQEITLKCDMWTNNNWRSWLWCLTPHKAILYFDRDGQFYW
jgi:hypothetical protein